MTNEQAIEKLNEMMEVIPFSKRELETVKIAIIALERLISKKVIALSNLEHYCPYCESEVVDECNKYSYCDSCGQKLDWE